MPSQALCIGGLCKRQILPIRERSLDFTIEQAQLLKQRCMTVLGQRLDQIFDHRAQPSYNLQIVRAAGADLAE